MFGKALVALLSVATVESAFAQTSEEDARQAFEKGLAAETAGNRAEACENFRRSLSLLRELGPLRKSTDCDIRDGRLMAARVALEELITRWPRAGAELDALKKEREAIGARIPTLTLELPAGAKATVRVDGKSVGVPSTIDLDPGDHEVVVDEVDKPLNRLAVRLAEGERRTLSIPAERASVSEPSGPSGLLIGGIVGLSVGGLALIGAGISGGLVLSKQADFEASCLSGSGSDCAVLAEEGQALLSANTALWIVGLASSGVGGTLLIIEAVTGPSVEATVGPASATLLVRF